MVFWLFQQVILSSQIHTTIEYLRWRTWVHHCIWPRDMKWFAKVMQLLLQIPLYPNKVRHFLTEMQSKAERRGVEGAWNRTLVGLWGFPPQRWWGWAGGGYQQATAFNKFDCVFPSLLWWSRSVLKWGSLCPSQAYTFSLSNWIAPFSYTLPYV